MNEWQWCTWEKTDRTNFVSRATLSESRFAELGADAMTLMDCSPSLHFAVLEHNMNSWVGYLNTLNSRRAISSDQVRFSPTTEIVAQRSLMYLTNALSSARAYFDATSSRLSREPELARTFMTAKAQAYDSSSNYRLCENLRNALQHTPYIPLNVRVEEVPGTQRIKHRIIAGRDNLLSSRFKWKAIVREDLKAGLEAIDFREVMESYWTSLIEIEQTRLISSLKHAAPAVGRLLQVSVEYDVPNELPQALMHFVTSGDTMNLTPIYLPSRQGLSDWLERVQTEEYESFFARPEEAPPNTHQTVVSVEAKAILRAWLAGGGEAATAVIDLVMTSPQMASNAIFGLLNLAAFALSQVELVLGLPPIDLLDSLDQTSATEPSEDMDRGAGS